MKRTILIITYILLLPLSQYAQEQYKVIGNGLNVRPERNVNNTPIAVLEKGEYVYLYDVKDKWGKIYFTDDTEGFVNMTYVRKIGYIDIIYSKVKQNPIEIFIATLIIVILILIVLTRFSKRCSSCKKWNAMRINSKVLLQEKDARVKKRVSVKTSSGETHYNTEYLPATESLFLITKKCKNCGDIIEYEKKEIKENVY